MHHGRLHVARRRFRTTTAVVKPPARRSPCLRRGSVSFCVELCGRRRGIRLVCPGAFPIMFFSRVFTWKKQNVFLRRLLGRVVVYVHSEKTEILCSSVMRRPDHLDPDHREIAGAIRGSPTLALIIIFAFVVLYPLESSVIVLVGVFSSK
jgi:hypothetical protein